MPNPIKGFQTKDGVRKYDYNELENLPETDPDDLALEVEEVKENIEAKKANIDGSYSSMTVGNAEQLVATVGEEDNAPYNFRTSGGTIDISDRETDMVVGGTICWNQIALKNLAYFEETMVTKQVSANEVTIVSATDNASVKGVFKRLTIGHVYYLCAAFETATDSLAAIGFRRGGVTISGGTITMGWESHSSYARMERIALCSQSEDIAGCFLQNDTLTGGSATFKDVQLFDLTQMFGSAVANHIHNLEAARLGDGVAFFKKLFPKDYYEYNAGELMSVKTSAHKMVGFNLLKLSENVIGSAFAIQTDRKTVKSIARDTRSTISYTINYYKGGRYARFGTSTVRTLSNGKKAIIITPPSDDSWDSLLFHNSGSSVNLNILSIPRSMVVPGHKHCLSFTEVKGDPTTIGGMILTDICINLSWDGERDGEYEEYEEHVYPLDSSLELRGIPKLDSANNLYYDGDTYESDGTVTRRFGVITFDGSEDELWCTYGGKRFYSAALIPNFVSPEVTILANVFSDGGFSLIQKTSMPTANTGVKYISAGDPGTKYVIVNFALDTIEEVKAYLANNPLTVIYELAEPTTETAEPYTNPQIVNDFGTEEYIDTDVESGDRDVAIPVGHQTTYMANLRAKLEMAPDSPSADGEYIVKQTNGQNEYTTLASSATMQSILEKLPSAPSEDGTYTLTVTVSNGTATYSWGANS